MKECDRVLFRLQLDSGCRRRGLPVTSGNLDHTWQQRFSRCAFLAQKLWTGTSVSSVNGPLRAGFRWLRRVLCFSEDDTAFSLSPKDSEMPSRE